MTFVVVWRKGLRSRPALGCCLGTSPIDGGSVEAVCLKLKGRKGRVWTPQPYDSMVMILKGINFLSHFLDNQLNGLLHFS